MARTHHVVHALTYVVIVVTAFVYLGGAGRGIQSAEAAESTIISRVTPDAQNADAFSRKNLNKGVVEVDGTAEMGNSVENVDNGVDMKRENKEGNGMGRYVKDSNGEVSRYTKLDNGLFQFTGQGSFFLFVGFLLQAVEPILLLILVSLANIIIILGIIDYIYSAMELQYRIPVIIWAYISALFIVVVVTWIGAALILVRHDMDERKQKQEKNRAHQACASTGCGCAH